MAAFGRASKEIIARNWKVDVKAAHPSEIIEDLGADRSTS